MTHEIQIERDFIDVLTERTNQWTYRNDIKTELEWLDVKYPDDIT